MGVHLRCPSRRPLVGWFTKIVAVKMMFHPLEFKGIRPFSAGRDRFPKRAAKMAAIAVDSITSKVLTAGGAL